MPRRKSKRNRRAVHKKYKKMKSVMVGKSGNTGLKQAILVFINTMYEKKCDTNYMDHAVEICLDNRDSQQQIRHYIKKSLHLSNANMNEMKTDYFLDVIFIVKKRYINKPTDGQTIIYNAFTELVNMTLNTKYSTFIKQCVKWCLDLCSSLPKLYSGRNIFECICKEKYEQYVRATPTNIEFFRYLEFFSELFNQNVINKKTICDIFNACNNALRIKECYLILKCCGKTLDENKESKQIVDKWFHNINQKFQKYFSCVCKSIFFTKIHALRDNNWKKTEIHDHQDYTKNQYLKTIFEKDGSVIYHKDILKKTASCVNDINHPKPWFIKNNCINSVIIYKHKEFFIFYKTDDVWMTNTKQPVGIPLILNYDYDSNRLEIITIAGPLTYHKITCRQLCKYNDKCGCIDFSDSIKIKCLNDKFNKKFVKVFNDAIRKIEHRAVQRKKMIDLSQYISPAPIHWKVKSVVNDWGKYKIRIKVIKHPLKEALLRIGNKSFNLDEIFDTLADIENYDDIKKTKLAKRRLREELSVIPGCYQIAAKNHGFELYNAIGFLKSQSKCVQDNNNQHEQFIAINKNDIKESDKKTSTKNVMNNNQKKPNSKNHETIKLKPENIENIKMDEKQPEIENISNLDKIIKSSIEKNTDLIQQILNGYYETGELNDLIQQILNGYYETGELNDLIQQILNGYYENMKNKHNNELYTLQSKLLQLEETYKSYKSKYEYAVKQEKESANNLYKSVKHNEKQKTKIESLKYEISDMNKKYNELKCEIDTSDQKHIQLQTKYNDMKIKSSNDLKLQLMQYNEIKVENNVLKDKLKRKENDVDKLQKYLTNSLNKSNSKREKLKQKYNSLKTEHSETIARQQAMQMEMNQIQNKYNEMKIKYDEKSDILMSISKLLVRNDNIDEENNKERKCIICLDGKSDHILIPCGHICVCIECKESYNDNNATCPICRGKVTSVIKTFN
eukprot:207170_1